MFSDRSLQATMHTDSGISGRPAPTLLSGTSAEGCPHRVADVLGLQRGQIGVHWQAQYLVLEPLRHRQTIRGNGKLAIERLHMQRPRIVDLGADAALGELLLQLVAAVGADRV